MAVTTVVITENVRMSRHWKAESGVYGICNQASPKFVHLLPLKPDRSPVCPVCPKSFLHLVLTSKSHSIKPCFRIDHMSDQRKAELINGNFGIQSFWEVMAKIRQILI
jgi:hypothetical protein